MTAEKPSGDELLSLAALALVDEICVRFEEEWRAGRQPRLEEFLAETPSPVRDELLPALLAVELGHRYRRGEALVAAEYLQRFPEAATVLPRLIAEAVGNEGGAGHTTPPGSEPTAVAPARADGPAVLGDYDLLEELGRGGMGVVYKARQRSANRLVALKFVRDDRLEGGSDAERQQWLDRFHREGHAAARLVHDHILPVYEVGEVGGRHFYSMRYVEGRSLAEVLRDGPLPERAAAACLERVARAIHYAHEQGILHRDLKPANILLDAEQRPFVTDFGLAKWAEGPQDMTRTGQLLGSPPYLSPEQSQDAAGVTAASDVYSLGATLYHAVTGRPPFQAAHVLETLRQIREDDPVPPRQLTPAVHRDLETICLKCLEKQPDKRYPAACKLADDLRRFLDCKSVQARPVSAVERGWRWCQRNPVLATVSGLAAGTLLTLATLVGTIGLHRYQEAVNRRHQQQLDEAHAALDHGLKLCEQGQVDLGLLWLARSLEKAPVDAANLQWSARTHLTAWVRQQGPRRVLLPHVRIGWAQFSRDGKTLLTVTQEKTARLWDATTGQPIGPPLQHPGVVWEVAFGLDGKNLIEGRMDETVHLWESIASQPDRFSARHQDVVVAQKLSSDGKILVTGSRDKTARLWDAATGRPVGQPLAHEDAVRAIALSPNGKLVLTASGSLARLWEVGSGQRIGKPLQHDDVVLAVAFSPDGRTALTGSQDKTARFWDTATGQPLRTLGKHQHQVIGVAFSPNGGTVVTTESDKARLWDAATGQPIDAVEKGDYYPGIAFSADGQIMATTGANLIRPCRTATGNPVGEPIRQVFASAIALSPDGKSLLTAENNRAQQWDTATGQPFGQPVRYPGSIWAVAFSPDGKTILTQTHEDVAVLWEYVTGRHIGQPLALQGSATSITLSPDGQTVLAGINEMPASFLRPKKGQARRWDAATGQPVGNPLPHPGHLCAVAFSPDGSIILTAGNDVVQRWEATSGRLLGEPLRHEGVTAVAFSPDGKIVLASGLDRRERTTFRLWETATGQVIEDPLLHQDLDESVAFNLRTERYGGTFFGSHQDLHNSVAFSPEGKIIPAIDKARDRLWNPAIGRFVDASFFFRHGPFPARAFSPDGKTILTGRDGALLPVDGIPLSDLNWGAAQLWEMATGRPIGPPLARGNFASVTFSPDGKTSLALARPSMRPDYPSFLDEFQGNSVLCDMTCLERDTQYLVLWLQVLTRKELATDGTVRELDDQTWQQRRQRLEELGGPPLL